MFQGETLTVVVQLDVSAEYHAHVLRPLRELECQVRTVHFAVATRGDDGDEPCAAAAAAVVVVVVVVLHLNDG